MSVKIKSNLTILDKDSTLFNPSTGTNFIFKISKPDGIGINLNKFNSDTLLLTKDTKSSKISLRINELEKLGCKIQFQHIQSDNLQLNLTLIDSQLPEILAYIILISTKQGNQKF